MAIVMGFDVSSSCIGWSVLEIDDNKNIKLIHADYLIPIKHENIIERLVDTRNRIKSIIEQYKPDHIGIENIISFMKGSSTANTIQILTTFNRCICLLAYDYLNKTPELFNVMSIRHGLKLNKILPSKDSMPELVSQHLGVKFNYELNRKGKIKVENYDKADGIAVGLYYSMILTDKIKKKKSPKSKK